MKITIIGINYAPEVTGVAVYTSGMAEGLAEMGHDVRVVTGLPHYPEWRVAENYRSTRRYCETIRGVTVQRVRHYVPEQPTSMARIRMEASFGRGAVTQNWHDPAVVIAVSPSLLATAAVVRFAKARRLPVGVIVQDLYSKGVVETGAMSGKAADLAERFELSTLRSASGVSVIHDRFSEALADMGVDSPRVTVIRNWTHDGAISAPSSNPAEVRRKYGWHSDDLIVLHAGNMGVKQGLDNVVSAAKLTNSDDGAGPKIRFVLVGDGNRRRSLEAAAVGLRNVSIIDPLPGPEFRDVINAADILLLNEKPGVGGMSVPSKLTTYFISGKPVLGATDKSSAAAHEIAASGAGVIVPPGDPAALRAGAVRMWQDKCARMEMGQSGKRYAEKILAKSVAMENYEQWCLGLAARSRSFSL